MLQLPKTITIVEVAPRDGLQSLGKWIDTDTKVKMIDRLSAAGFPVIEVTGFAHPRVIPNLRDAEDVCARISRRKDVVYRGLVPNAHGAERAVGAGLDEMLGLITISNTYLKKNQNMTRDQAIAQALKCFEVAARNSISFVMAMGSSMWCPYEGRIPEEDVFDVTRRLYEGGARRFYLAGSLGLEDPSQVGRLFRQLYERHPDIDLGFHAHNMGGFGTANVLAAVDAGASWIEGAVCGIGGGVALPSGFGAAGNLATEDIVMMLTSAGVDTGVTAGETIAAAREIARLLQIEPHSHAAFVGTHADVRARTNANLQAASVD